MDVISEAINKKALEEVAKEFDVSKEDARKIIKIYTDYLFYHINAIDLTKDLSKQYTRFKVPYVGEVRLSPVFIFENEFHFGRFTTFEEKWIRSWYSKTFHYFKRRLNLFRENLKTTDND